MLKRLSQRERIALLIETWEPAIRRAFLDAVADIRSKITLKIVADRLEKHDIAGAIDALHIEREAFGGLESAIAQAYEGGGVAMAEDLLLRDPDGSRVVFRFGVRNPEAEEWLRSHSAQLVTRIIEDQREGIRTALTEGLARGDNPRTTALSVVGRVNRVTGKREGGVIGLTAQQERAAARALGELLSGEPDQLRAYLARERRDKRFDRVVGKAITGSEKLDVETVNKIVGRYSDRLLQLRGEMLARTETMFALGSARNEAMRQAIVSGKVDADLVTKHWRSAGDGRVRHSHRVLNGQSVGFNDAFLSPWGNRLRFPGDPEAPISETSGCRCTVEYKIDHTAQVLRRRAA